MEVVGPRRDLNLTGYAQAQMCPVCRTVSLLELGQGWWRDGVHTRRA